MTTTEADRIVQGARVDKGLTMRAFVRRHKITATTEWADENPNMTDMPQGSTHWQVTLRFGRRRLTVLFSQGPAHTQEPTAEGVLGCLLSTVGSVACADSFEDWAAEMGWDADSRKAERCYRVTARQAAKLRQFLGDTYDEAVQAAFSEELRQGST